MINTPTRLLALSLCALMACNEEAPASADRDPTLSEPSDLTCAIESVTPLIGEKPTALETLDIPAPFRVIRPGMAITEDYRPERTNIDIGQDGRISRVWCG
ncbi:I78 family peptidase inhibitor [uncultured Celeribacter sp.]|uniref:I78 family peptidase inhibitor n=1 Tax=uncultured Celeribacter sp. TaxID=1303376 RepID=UPI002AA7ADC1|nr:I78 family peptidase inhibitor [uncultured Celeribacter sp.]